MVICQSLRTAGSGAGAGGPIICLKMNGLRPLADGAAGPLRGRAASREGRWRGRPLRGRPLRRGSRRDRAAVHYRRPIWANGLLAGVPPTSRTPRLRRLPRSRPSVERPRRVAAPPRSGPPRSGPPWSGPRAAPPAERPFRGAAPLRSRLFGPRRCNQTSRIGDRQPRHATARAGKHDRHRRDTRRKKG